ncbi:MAG: aminotransferase class I/II-fold pyridoxal phosphate-dependent enzyme [Gammaproteobacteria bacterium]|nr:aminotransferase class I/II-fold pyridoxal phosphate-dependent enzyme [Gammaproteobacteria bacterium]
MDYHLSDRVKAIKPSATMAVTDLARELKEAGQDVIGLGVGEPDFDTPEHIKEAARRALAEGFTKYTAADGTPGLKDAIIEKFRRDNELYYERANIVISCGAKHSVFNLTQAVLNPGDELVVAAPYWVSYTDMGILAGAEPVVIQTNIDRQFKMTPEQLEEAITPRSRLLILNSPSNPTGGCYTKAQLQALGEVLARHPQIMICTDDIYEHISWGEEPFCSFATACPELLDRTIVINGVSKVYAMTGWRIGYAAAPVPVANAIRKIQSQSTGSPPSVSQYAAQAALSGAQSEVGKMVQVFKERHDYVVGRLNAMPGMRCLPAQGAFYAFPDVSEAIASIEGVEDDTAFCEWLLSATGVAVVPGAAFGTPGCLRITYATSVEVLEEALNRIQAALGNR